MRDGAALRPIAVAALPQPSPWASVDLPATGRSAPVVSAMTDVLKPYLLLACVAFVVGFAGYLAVGRALTVPAEAGVQAYAPVAAPVATPPLARTRTI